MTRPALVLVIAALSGHPAEAEPAGEQSKRASLTPLPTEAVEALRRGIVAADAGAWRLALQAFTQAHTVAPRAPSVLLNLGVVHAAQGHETAAAAWMRAYLAAAPNAPDAAAVAREADLLLGAAETRARTLVGEAQAIQRELHEAEVRTGMRGFATVAAMASVQAEDMAGARAAITAIDDVTDRDAAWEEISRALEKYWEDPGPAEAAAKSIGDPVRRAQVLATLSPSAPPPPGFETWRRLATELSEGAETHPYTDALRALSQARGNQLAQVPLRLAQMAAHLAGNALRVRKLQARFPSR